MGPPPCAAVSPGRIRIAAGIVSAAAPRKTQRQPRWSTTSPASPGPTIAGTTHAAANAENTAGRRSGANTRATSTYSATPNSPLPTPWTARPAIRAPIPVAVPATTSPTTNSATPVHIAGVGPVRSHHRPAVSMPTTLVAKTTAKANV